MEYRFTFSFVIQTELQNKHWSGLPGCFLRKYVNYYCVYPGNLLTIWNTMEKPILLQSLAKGIRKNIFLRVLN